MKSIIFVCIGLLTSLQLLAIDPVGKIAKANAAKEKAEEAFKNGDYEGVIKSYSYLLDSLHYVSPQAELNRAHAYFQLNDTINAFDSYRRVSEVSNAELKSTAMLQLGNLSEMQKENESALAFFKEAIKADPTNEKARFNYELLKKKMKRQEEQDQNKDQDQDKEQQDQDKESEDQENQEGQDSENQEQEKDQDKSQEDKESEEQQQKDEAEQQEGEEGEQDKQDQDKDQQEQQKEGEEKEDGEESEMNPSTKQKLEEMNISEEKAQMILEALRNKESQYIQQLRKKPTKKQDSRKPDW